MFEVGFNFLHQIATLLLQTELPMDWQRKTNGKSDDRTARSETVARIGS
jgi:hypothetical protein